MKLIWGSTSANYHSFAINEHNKVSIWTEKFFVQNSGRKAASKIEIVFSDSLTSYNLWTPRDHKSKRSDNGNFVIQVPSLAPGELLIVDVIDVDMRSPKLLTVNCPDALSEEVQFAAMRQFGWLMQSLIVYLILAGFLGSVYLVLKILMGGK
ncbi:hypothetical protein [Paracoccus alkenifer]|uniref:hypothetical protein n=1 Tax=Paracoccus alkenifer TaxID=65735 RepID=UPI00115FB8AE|nr:hypothetical protein [Paracoccus alkenifer]